MSSRLKRGLLLAAACQMAMMGSQSNVFGYPQSWTNTGNTLADGKPRKQQPKKQQALYEKVMERYNEVKRK